MAGHILLAEDDKALSALMQDFFRAAGVAVTPAYDGEQALVLAQAQPFDLLVLDVMMPHLNGLEVCEAVRQESDVPVIFVTALGQEGDTLAGFRAGADDYITKPFRVRELISRMNSVLRRAGKKQAETTINYQDLSINTIAARVFKNNQEVFLTGMEYRLLLILATHRNQVMTRDQLFEAIWDLGGEYVNDNTLTVYIKRLREKLEDDPAHPQLIRTIRGLGYKLGE